MLLVAAAALLADGPVQIRPLVGCGNDHGAAAAAAGLLPTPPPPPPAVARVRPWAMHGRACRCSHRRGLAGRAVLRLQEAAGEGQLLPAALQLSRPALAALLLAGLRGRSGRCCPPWFPENRRQALAQRGLSSQTDRRRAGAPDERSDLLCRHDGSLLGALGCGGAAAVARSLLVSRSTQGWRPGDASSASKCRRSAASGRQGRQGARVQSAAVTRRSSGAPRRLLVLPSICGFACANTSRRAAAIAWDARRQDRMRAGSPGLGGRAAACR